MTTNVVRFTFEKLGTELSLPYATGLHPVSFNFATNSGRIDDGPTQPVAQLFANALCRHFNVTFLCDLAAGASAKWEYAEGFYAQRQKRFLKQKMPVIWTKAPELAVLAFESSWSMQGQFILLSESDTPVDFDIYSLQGNPTAILSFLEVSTFFCGAFLPGVDGDVAGLYFREARKRDSFVNDLQQLALFADIGLLQTNRDDFLVTFGPPV
jgi:hypothetical protein